MKKRRISLTLLLLTLALIFASAAMASNLDASALTDTPDIYLLPPDVPTESTFPDSGEYIPDVIAPTPEFNAPEDITPTPGLNPPEDIIPTPELNPPEDITPTPELNSPEDMTPILSDWHTVEFWVSDEDYLPPAPVTVQNGEAVYMPELSPVIAPSGRRFVGWSSDFQAVIPDYRPGEIVTPTRNLFLYAVFAPESCEVIYQIGADQFRETVLTGNAPQQVPALPYGFYSWVDESGNFIKPEEIAIWTSRLFVASDIQAVPTVTPSVPPVTPTVTPFEIQPTPTITAPALKSDNHHTAFMSGFNDGLFHPERSLTRAQTVKILYGLIDESAKTQEINQESNPAYFSDVSQDAWYAEPLYALAAMNIIIPDENNAFRGDNPITRAEFAVILSNFIPANYNQDPGCAVRPSGRLGYRQYSRRRVIFRQSGRLIYARRRFNTRSGRRRIQPPVGTRTQSRRDQTKRRPDFPRCPRLFLGLRSNHGGVHFPYGLLRYRNRTGIMACVQSRSGSPRRRIL